MEQKTKSTAAAQRASQITALRTEASDTVRHSWPVLTGMNILSVLIPILIPAAYVLLAVLQKLPLTVETVLGGVIALLVGMALQSYAAVGHSAALAKMAAGKEVHFREIKGRLDDAGRGLALLLLGLIVLCASVVPGGAVAALGLGLGGAWKTVVTAVGIAVAVALLVVILLSCCLALYCLAADSKCGAAVALLRSARLMKGHKRQLVVALLPSLLLMVGLTAAMALLLWPLAVKRDFLTDTLMIVGGVAYVIAAAYSFMRTQAMTACLYNSVVKE